MTDCGWVPVCQNRPPTLSGSLSYVRLSEIPLNQGARIGKSSRHPVLNEYLRQRGVNKTY